MNPVDPDVMIRRIRTIMYIFFGVIFFLGLIHISCAVLLKNHSEIAKGLFPLIGSILGIIIGDIILNRISF